MRRVIDVIIVKTVIRVKVVIVVRYVFHAKYVILLSLHEVIR